MSSCSKIQNSIRASQLSCKRPCAQTECEGGARDYSKQYGWFYMIQIITLIRASRAVVLSLADAVPCNRYITRNLSHGRSLFSAANAHYAHCHTGLFGRSNTYVAHELLLRMVGPGCASSGRRCWYCDSNLVTPSIFYVQVHSIKLARKPKLPHFGSWTLSRMSTSHRGKASAQYAPVP